MAKRPTKRTSRKYVGSTGKFREGNPGRPVGSKNVATKILDAIGAEEAENVLKVVIAQAKKKDMTAAAIVLKRLWPEPRGRLINLDLPKVVDSSSLLRALAGVADAMGSGVISAEEASAACSVLGVVGEAIKLFDLEKRLKIVEETLAK